MPLTAGSADVLTTPLAPTVLQNTQGAGASVTYQVVAVNAAGQDSVPSPNTITGANNATPNPNNTLTWTLLPGQVQTRILKNGALLATVGAGVTTFSDNAGLSTSAYTAQSTNPAYASYVTNAPVDGGMATYCIMVQGLASAASATDIFAIGGSANKVIKVTKVFLTATQTTGGTIEVYVLKRTTGTQSAGTSQAANITAYDTNNPTPTAAVYTYTVNPASVGTGVTTLWVQKWTILTPTATVPHQAVDVRFGDRPAQAATLRGVTQFVTVNLNAVTITGSSFDLFCEWTEL